MISTVPSSKKLFVLYFFCFVKYFTFGCPCNVTFVKISLYSCYVLTKLLDFNFARSLMQNTPFTIDQVRPIRDGMTISRPAHLGDSLPVTWFSMGAGTSITPEYYDCTTLYLGSPLPGTFILGKEARQVPLGPNELLLVPPATLCGTTAPSGMIYTEIILKKENYTMNDMIKAGTPTNLADLISYEEGSIANLDIVHADNMKYVLMAFDEGTGLTPHRAPGNAILTALEGTAIIGYEGTDYELKAGESFRFDKEGLHSVTPQGRFKMSLLLVLE